MGSGGVAIAALPTVICLEVPFSDGLGGCPVIFFTFPRDKIELIHSHIQLCIPSKRRWEYNLGILEGLKHVSEGL